MLQVNRFGWAVGGVVFGYICDRIGRTKTLLMTMLLYTIGTFSWGASHYFGLSSAALILGFGSKMPAELDLWKWLYFAIGLTVFGVFGAFTYYLPELFPTRLRSTGSGFCYNAGRLITAIRPFIVGGVASRSDNPLQTALQLLFFGGFILLLGILVMPLVIETKHHKLIT
jgi:MFS family permease